MNKIRISLTLMVALFSVFSAFAGEGEDLVQRLVITKGQWENLLPPAFRGNPPLKGGADTAFEFSLLLTKEAGKDDQDQFKLIQMATASALLQYYAYRRNDAELRFYLNSKQELIKNNLSSLRNLAKNPIAFAVMKLSWTNMMTAARNLDMPRIPEPDWSE